jgi:hypothetical protein
MTIPYTYKLIFKPTGQYYYGVRYAKNCNPNDLWDKYFTSSKHIHKLIKEYGLHSFIVKITKTFTNKVDALNHEKEILIRVKADKNGKFINKHIFHNTPINTGLIVIHHNDTNVETFHDPNIPIPTGWLAGFSESHLKSMSTSQTGKPHKKRDFYKKTGPCSNERKTNISKSRKLTPKLICEHCGKQCDGGNFKRFHGINCKFNPNIDQQVIKERSNIAKKSYSTQTLKGNFNIVKPIFNNYVCKCGKIINNHGSYQNHVKYCPIQKQQ